MLWYFLHLIAAALYVFLPLAAIGRVVLARRRDEPVGPRVSTLVVTFFSALAIALTLCLIYGHVLNGHVPLRQVLLATYFAAAMLLLLRCFDIVLLWVLRRLTGLHRPGRPGLIRALKSLTVMLARAFILVAVGLPFVMAAVMTYRPKVIPSDDPVSQLGYPFQRVEFASSDGVKLVGWWIPAIDPRCRSQEWEGRGRQTAIICHGLAAGKSNHLILARRLVPGGFNVLVFDFRAHGESDGQLTSYGALETRDVLAAVKWVREAHPDQCEKIVGVGASMGAAALISAAADSGPEGQSISAIAAYGAYDDLPNLLHDIAAEHFRPPVGFLVEHLGLTIASAHVGVNLAGWAPDRLVRRVWPRPILFIHGQLDQIIPIERGQSLYDAASQPKYHVWFPKGDHNDILVNDTAAEIVLEFFKSAVAVPVI